MKRPSLICRTPAMCTDDFNEPESRSRGLRDWTMHATEACLDVVRPIALQHWPTAARQLSHGPGWMPPMALIAGFGTILFSHGLFGRVLFLHTPHVITVMVVSLGAMYFIVRRFLAVLVRFGFSGVFRPRWWFELARGLWIACIVSIATYGAAGFAGLGNAAPVVAGVFMALRIVASYSFVAFLFTATVGYGLSVARQLPRKGRAFECVQFFYGIIVACAAVIPAVVLFRADRSALVALGIAAAALVAAGVIAAFQRKKDLARIRLSQAPRPE